MLLGGFFESFPTYVSKEMVELFDFVVFNIVTIASLFFFFFFFLLPVIPATVSLLPTIYHPHPTFRPHPLHFFLPSSNACVPPFTFLPLPHLSHLFLPSLPNGVPLFSPIFPFIFFPNSPFPFYSFIPLSAFHISSSFPFLHLPILLQSSYPPPLLHGLPPPLPLFLPLIPELLLSFLLYIHAYRVFIDTEQPR